MQQFKPTRMELLRTKKRINLAKKGHKLLKQKRDVLIMEFFSVLKDVKQLRKKMSDHLTKAQSSLYNAIASEGILNVERMSLGLTRSMQINIANDKVMGVSIPRVGDIKIDYEWPGFGDESVEFDNAIVKYRSLFPDLMHLAGKQLILNKIAKEIKKTKRRVNALEFLTIPRLEDQKRLISFRLEELERENFARLKVIKKHRTG